MNRNNSSFKPRIPLRILIPLAVIYLVVAGSCLIMSGIASGVIPLVMYVYFGYREWRIIDRYIKRVGKGGPLRAVIGIHFQIAAGLLMLSFTSFFSGLFWVLFLVAPGMAVGGFVCAILLIGSLMRRGADRRLEIDWLPATVLYVGLCLHVLWGVWVLRPIVDEMRYAQYRPRVARVHSEMRSVCMGLEVYASDYGVYPPPMSLAGAPLVFSASAPASGLVPFSLLTTPVAYLRELPTDHFGKKAGSLSCRYITDGSASLLVSVGPDGVLDCPLDKLPGILKSKGTSFPALLAEWASTCQYDASNGTVSKGDIIRIGP